METQPAPTPTVVVSEDALESIDIGGQLTEVMGPLMDMLAPIMILSVVVTVLFVFMYILSMFRRRKLEKAILDMQKILHEMNERDKARSLPQQPQSKLGTIAGSTTTDDSIG